MKSITFIILSILILNTSGSYAQFKIGDVVNTVNTTVNKSGVKLTNEEVIAGLKEALSVGTNNSAKKASVVDGFYKNTAIKIPFPSEAKQMESRLRQMGMNKQVDDFIMTLNRAAEEAAKDAAPIFLASIKKMTVTDGINILKGSDNAATSYLKQSTNNELTMKFQPVVKNALNKVQITKYWSPLSKKYNKLPMVKKVNPDLEKYVTQKAIEGLFKLVADEELKIRKDPGSRVNDLLKKVFG